MKKISALLALCFFLMAGTAFATLTTIGNPPSNEFSIFSILDSLYGSGNYQRIDDDFDQIWMNLNGGATAKAKYAGDQHGFGYIDGSNSYKELFVASVGATSTTPDMYTLPTFKWALDNKTTQRLYTSDPSDNWDGMDHMVTWLVTGGNSAGNYVIAWEDRGTGEAWEDWDFNDLVVEISKAAPVPEPATMLLLGFGLVGLAALGRRNLLKK